MFSLRIEDDAELRLLEESDAEEMFALLSKDRVQLQTGLPWLTDDFSLSDALRFISKSLERFAAGEGFRTGIRFRGEFAGSVNIYNVNAPARSANIGYWLGTAYQGRGLVTRACRALLNYGFDELRLNRFEIQCAADNRKSRGIPERLGFTQEGILRQADWLHDRFVDIVVYGMLAEEWVVLRPESTPQMDNEVA